MKTFIHEKMLIESGTGLGHVWEMQSPDMNIFSYCNYRTFLKSFASLKKSEKSNWSLGKWSQELGLSGTSVIVNILQGKRHPGPKLVIRLMEYFDFDEHRRSYFESLVLLEKSTKNPELTKSLLQNLRMLSPADDFQRLDDKVFESISCWYFYAIREMALLPQFEGSVDWIARRLIFYVSKKKIEEALQILLDLDLLKKDQDGIPRPTNRIIHTQKDVRNVAVQKFHEEMIGLGRESIKRVPVLKRDIAGRTFNIDPKSLPLIKNELSEFRENLEKKYGVNSESALSGRGLTYQLNIQLFPLMKGNKDEE